jgi:hypothetical protein
MCANRLKSSPWPGAFGPRFNWARLKQAFLLTDLHKSQGACSTPIGNMIVYSGSDSWTFDQNAQIGRILQACVTHCCITHILPYIIQPCRDSGLIPAGGSRAESRGSDRRYNQGFISMIRSKISGCALPKSLDRAISAISGIIWPRSIKGVGFGPLTKTFHMTLV